MLTQFYMEAGLIKECFGKYAYICLWSKTKAVKLQLVIRQITNQNQLEKDKR